MNRRTVVLGLIAFLNLGASLAVQLYLVWRLGLGGAMDAFFAASTLPQVVLAVLVGSAVNVLTPFFSGRSSGKDFAADAWAILFWTFSALTLIAILIAALAGVSTGLLLPGLASSDRRTAIVLTAILAAGLPFAALTQVATAIHQGRSRFILTGSVDAAMSVALLCAILHWTPSGGVNVAAWLFTLRAALQAVVLMAGLGAPSFQPMRPAVQAVLTGMRPLLLSTSYFKLAPLLDRWLASFGAPGDISLLHLLQQVFAGAAALFGKAVTEPLIGSLATNRKGGASVVKRLGAYRKIACTIAWLAIAGYAAGLGAAVLFGKSLVGMEAAHRLMPFVVAFGGLYTAGFLGQLAAAWFYANGDTRTPARVGAIGFSLGIAVRLALFPFTGALAIAVAISANQVVNWLMLRRAIRTTWAGHDVPVS